MNPIAWSDRRRGLLAGGGQVMGWRSSLGGVGTRRSYMRQALTRIVGGLAVLLAFAGTAGAADPDCPPAGLFVVDTAAKAALVADDFN
jgi:hypothetical protein